MTKLVFHIGLHKTASSWLQRIVFPQHPQIAPVADSAQPQNDPLLGYLIATPQRKFDAIACRKILTRQIRSLDNQRNDQVFVVSAERLSGHPISGGYDTYNIAERIKLIAPDARIVMVVRTQIDMISSVYKQMVREGYPGTLPDLLNAKSWKAPAFDLSYFEYDLLVMKYAELFGRKNLLILPYELLKVDSIKFLNGLFNFLEISQFESYKQDQRVNENVPLTSLSLLRKLNYFRTTELNLFPILSLPEFSHRKIRNMVATASRRIPEKRGLFPEALSRELTAHYHESNQRLLCLTDINYVE